MNNDDDKMQDMIEDTYYAGHLGITDDAVWDGDEEDPDPQTTRAYDPIYGGGFI